MGNRELLGLSSEELRVYQVNNWEFDATIKQIIIGKKLRNNKIRTLTKILLKRDRPSKRAKAFIEYI
jgi:hypothetical protein